MQIAYYKAGVLQKVIDITLDKSEFFISRVGGEGNFLIEDPRVSKLMQKLLFYKRKIVFY